MDIPTIILKSRSKLFMQICYLFDIDLIERKEYPNFPKLPNHAIMKLSSYYKLKGYEVKLIYSIKQIPITHNPNNIYIGSALYTGNLNRFKRRLNKPKKYKNQLTIDKIHIGTPTDTCPITDIKGLQCDYTEYDKMIKQDNIKLGWYPVNVGFLTRGCKRHCKFCVNRDKNEIKPVNTLEEIYVKKGYDIELLDDNLFASDNATEYLNQIADFAEKHNIQFELRNGLDLRAKPKPDKLKALNRASKYFRSLHCAWDDVKNTYIFNNIMDLKKHTNKEIRCYILCGVNITNEKELYNDLLGLFYRYYLLRKINTKPYIAVFEDDTLKYHNPYFNLYKLIKNRYYIMNANLTTYLKRQISLSNLTLADTIIDILGDYSWLVEKKVGKIVDMPNFYNVFNSIADEINVKHVNPEVMNFRKIKRE